MVQVYEMSNLPKNVVIPMQHSAEHEMAEGTWEEKEYNYRLNSASTIIYAVINKKVIGHLGISSDDEVLGVYVDPEFRGRGIAISLYEYAVKLLGTLWSDPFSQETGGKGIWKELKRIYPDEVSLGKNKFVFKKGNYFMKNKELVAKVINKLKAFGPRRDYIPKEKYDDVLKIIGDYPESMKNISNIEFTHPLILKVTSDIPVLDIYDMKNYHIDSVSKGKSGIDVNFYLNKDQEANIKSILNQDN